MSSAELLEAAVDLLWRQNLLHGISQGYARLESDAQLRESWEAERAARGELEVDRLWREQASQEVMATAEDEETQRRGYADAT